MTENQRHVNGVCPAHPTAHRYTTGQSSNGRCSECVKAYRRAHYAKVGLTEKQRFYAMKANAKRRKAVWTLTYKQWSELMGRPCTYAHGKQESIRVGLDQRAAGLGYTPENAQPCCAKHNLVKSDTFTHARFVDIVRSCDIPCGNTKGGRPRTGSNVQSAYRQ
jgi:hypothetical protein